VRIGDQKHCASRHGDEENGGRRRNGPVEFREETKHPRLHLSHKRLILISFRRAGTAIAFPRFNRNEGLKMFDAIWKVVVWADGAMEANGLPAIIAFITSAVITSFLKSLLGAL
jgi:hypothetical protein